MLHTHKLLLAVLLMAATGALTGAALYAQDAATEDATLPEVVVHGDQPGPGLWRVSRDGHEAWILGTLSPLPAKITWRSADADRHLTASQALILPPRAKATVHPGIFGGIMLMGSLVGVRDNPDGAKLAGIVPADVYRQWLVLKAKYLGENDAVERMRPMFAAQELYKHALTRSGLDVGKEIVTQLSHAAKEHNIPVVTPEIEILVQQPRDAVKRFKQAKLDDLDCFRQTTAKLETDLNAIRARANAWATGDVDGLQRLSFYDPLLLCYSTYEQVAQSIGPEFNDVRGRMATVWLDAVQNSLRDHPETMAVAPFNDLVRDDGYLAALRKRGYTVEAPHSVHQP